MLILHKYRDRDKKLPSFVRTAGKARQDEVILFLNFSTTWIASRFLFVLH